jgi:hypothetical protein
MVSGKSPVGVLLVVVMVRVDVPDVTTDAGAKEAELPAGKPVTLKLTVPV